MPGDFDLCCQVRPEADGVCHHSDIPKLIIFPVTRGVRLWTGGPEAEEGPGKNERYPGKWTLETQLLPQPKEYLPPSQMSHLRPFEETSTVTGLSPVPGCSGAGAAVGGELREGWRGQDSKNSELEVASQHELLGISQSSSLLEASLFHPDLKDSVVSADTKLPLASAVEDVLSLSGGLRARMS